MIGISVWSAALLMAVAFLAGWVVATARCNRVIRKMTALMGEVLAEAKKAKAHLEGLGWTESGRQ